MNVQLLTGSKIERVRIDVTSRCNLRCVYCSVSEPGYRGNDMRADHLEKAIAFIEFAIDQNPNLSVDVNGHGETTYLEGWAEVCRRVLAITPRTIMTTNLSKSYSDEELAVLARLETIHVSVDVADRTQLRKLRRKADINAIIANIMMIRAKALQLGCKGPNLSFLAGVFDQSAIISTQLARLAVVLGATEVVFWELTEHDGDKVPQDLGDYQLPVPLSKLAPAELAICVNELRASTDILTAGGVAFRGEGLRYVFRQ